MTTLLGARQVTKIFGRGLLKKQRTIALEDFSLSIGSGQPMITSVVGESGSGKTTMARLLLGLESPTLGDVLYKGRDLRRLSPTEWRAFRRDVQAIFQDPFEVYNPFYKVDHVLTVPIAKFHLANSPGESRALMEKALQAVGLRSEETLGRYPHQLSGGQRQRVMVARALLVKPQLIIADEPVSMIDASLRATVLADLRQLNEEFGISFIYITHDVTTAYQISSNVIVLYSGSIMEAGDVELVIKQPQHPYTKLLVSSIPLPDPHHRWSDELPAPAFRERAGDNGGCKFASRCPYVTSGCRQKAPPLFQIDPHRAAACYLYQAHPLVQTEEMDKIFVQRRASDTGQPVAGGSLVEAG
ncbi:MAG: ABC transporter ATP-binding protein [Chloroflexi bacterium]|nr:ABC transporter ATP-binding protein [Chloroflexota bacterium]